MGMGSIIEREKREMLLSGVKENTGRERAKSRRTSRLKEAQSLFIEKKRK